MIRATYPYLNLEIALLIKSILAIRPEGYLVLKRLIIFIKEYNYIPLLENEYYLFTNIISTW